eukprot:SAG31_NODE_5063_length_2763_cov_8.216967_4_plen_73_part_00
MDNLELDFAPGYPSIGVQFSIDFADSEATQQSRICTHVSRRNGDARAVLAILAGIAIVWDDSCHPSCGGCVV